MALKFRAFGHKKTKTADDPPIVVDPIAIQHLAPIQDPILALLGIAEVDASLIETPLHSKRKGKQPVVGTLKKCKKKGEENSAFLLSLSVHAELWRPKFSIVDLDKQVTISNSTKDPDTSLALA